MRSLLKWMSGHPIKACLFAVVFTFTAAVVALTGIPLKAGIVAYAGLVVLFALIMRRDIRRAVATIIVVCCMLAQNQRVQAADPSPIPVNFVGLENDGMQFNADQFLIPLFPVEEQQIQPAAGGVAIGVVVVVVGGVAVYFLAKTCQRLFPKTPKPNTNAPPDELIGILGAAGVGSSDDYAASWMYSSYSSCYFPGDFRAAAGGSETEVPTLMELDGTVLYGENGLEFRLATTQKLSVEDNMQGPAGFASDLAANGITFGTVGQMSFGKNGRPVSAAEVPISFSSNDGTSYTVTISNGNPTYSVALERSSDLVVWETVSTANISVGQRIRLLDATVSNQMFYRFRPL